MAQETQKSLRKLRLSTYGKIQEQIADSRIDRNTWHSTHNSYIYRRNQERATWSGK